MFSSTACCCCRSSEIINRYSPKQQQVVSPGSNTLPGICKVAKEKWMQTPCGQQSKQAENHKALSITLGSRVISLFCVYKEKRLFRLDLINIYLCISCMVWKDVISPDPATALTRLDPSYLQIYPQYWTVVHLSLLESIMPAMDIKHKSLYPHVEPNSFFVYSCSEQTSQNKQTKKCPRHYMDAVDTLENSVRKCLLHYYQPNAACFTFNNTMYSSCSCPSSLKRANSEQRTCVYT